MLLLVLHLLQLQSQFLRGWEKYVAIQAHTQLENPKISGTSSVLKNCSPAMHLPHAMHMGTHYAIHIDWVVVGSNQLHKATCMPCHAQGF